MKEGRKETLFKEEEKKTHIHDSLLYAKGYKRACACFFILSLKKSKKKKLYFFFSSPLV